MSAIIGTFHPDLPFGWDYGVGKDTVIDALAGDFGDAQQKIAEMGLQLVALLLVKNARYGNSALAPTAVFAKDLTPRQRMAIRMDDKVSRIANGAGRDGGDGEDPGFDLAGYLILDAIAAWDESQSG